MTPQQRGFRIWYSELARWIPSLRPAGSHPCMPGHPFLPAQAPRGVLHMAPYWLKPRLSSPPSLQAPPHLRFPLEDDNSATLVACGQQLPGMVELNGRDDVGCGGGRGEQRQEGVAH